jgi:hypothetical protein
VYTTAAIIDRDPGPPSIVTILRDFTAAIPAALSTVVYASFPVAGAKTRVRRVIVIVPAATPAVADTTDPARPVSSDAKVDMGTLQKALGITRRH